MILGGGHPYVARQEQVLVVVCTRICYQLAFLFSCAILSWANLFSRTTIYTFWHLRKSSPVFFYVKAGALYCVVRSAPYDIQLLYEVLEWFVGKQSAKLRPIGILKQSWARHKEHHPQTQAVTSFTRSVTV